MPTPFQHSILSRAGTLAGLLMLAGGLISTRVYGYDDVADFSTNANPAGVWSYGWATNANGPFQPLTTEATFHPGPDAGWDNNGTVPDAIYVDKNYSNNVVTSGTVEFYPDTIHMDPQSYAAYVRFTAPSNYAYQVSGFFRLQDTGAKSHALSIMLDSTNLTAYSQVTTGGANGSLYPFSFPCYLRQGETVDFIVSSTGDYGNLSTGLKATVTPGTNAVTAAYSVVRDFNTAQNPNGVWSYVYWTNSTFAGPVQLLNTNVYEVTGQTNIYSWWNGLSGATQNGVIISVDNATNPYPETAHSNVFYYPDTVELDPEKLATAARFTAPYKSIYAVQGFFRVQDSELAVNGYAAALEVITNGSAASPVFVTNSLGAPLETQYPFSLSLSLNAGDTVDFAVAGAYGDALNLNSGVSVTLSPANPVLQSVGYSGGNLTFAFQSIVNQGYTILSATNLLNPNWTTYNTGTGSGSLITNTVPLNPAKPVQFFEVSFP